MKILEPQVKLLSQGDAETLHIAKCARICYASNKLVDNKKMCNHLWKNHHHSMFRHVGVYYKIPYNEIYKAFFIHNILYNPYCNVAKTSNYLYVSTNRQYAKEYLQELSQYEIAYEVAVNDEVFYSNKMLYYTFVIDTGIDITRELNRKSPNAISERSTRYVDFIRKLVLYLRNVIGCLNLIFIKKV